MPIRPQPSANDANPIDSDTNDIFNSNPETVNLVGVGIRGKAFMRAFYQQRHELPPLVRIGVDDHAPDRHTSPKDEDHFNRLSAIPPKLCDQILHAYGWALHGAAALFIAQEEHPEPQGQEEAEALVVLAQDRDIPVFRVALHRAGGRAVHGPEPGRALQRLCDATLVLPQAWQDSAELLALRWLFASLLHLAQEGMMVWQSWDMYDVQEVLCTPGTVLYAMTAEAAGPVRAKYATTQAIDELAERGIDLEEASGVLVILAAGEDLHRLRELREAVGAIRRGVGSDVFILPLTPELGYDSPEDVLTVTVVVSVRPR